MPDDTNGTPPEGQESTPAITNSDDGNEQEPFDEARARATIEAQRKSEREALKRAAEAEKRLTALEDEERKRKEAEQSELERAQARAEAAEKAALEAAERVRETETRTAVIIAANKLNVIDVEAAYTLLDKGDIEYDDGGKPTNVDSVLEALVKAKPYLVKTEQEKQGVPGSPKASNGKSRDEMVTQTKNELAASGRYSL